MVRIKKGIDRFHLPLILLLIFPIGLYSFSSGPPDGYCGDPPNYNNCTTCHSSYPPNSGDGSIQILGLPDEYLPGTTYALTVFVEDQGQSRWGFEMTVIKPSDGLQAGEFVPVDSTYVQVSIGQGEERDYVKQTSLGTFAGQMDSASWHINWIAPDSGTGPAHFYLACNAANNNGLPSGDYIYLLDIEIDESPSSVDEEEVTLAIPSLAVYPNPADGGSFIRFVLPSDGVINLRILDNMGRVVRVLYNGFSKRGEYTFFWDGRDLSGYPVPEGIYHCLLKEPGGTLKIPLIILRRN
jgi:hypothetical protein